jgi:hypothetical protein
VVKEPCIGHKINSNGKLLKPGNRNTTGCWYGLPSNAYFTQILSVISMPDQAAELKKAVDRFYEEDLQFAEDLADIQKELKKPKFAELANFGANVVWAEVKRRKSGLTIPDKSIKQVELEALLSCPEEMGKEVPAADKDFQGYARRLDTLDAK